MMLRHALCLSCSLLVIEAAVWGCGAGTPPPADPAEPPTTPPAASSSVTPAAGTASGLSPQPAGSPEASSAPAPSPPAEASQIQVCPEPKDRSRLQLGASDATEVVRANRSHLNTACWAPAIRKNPNGPDKVRLAAEITVQGDGRVSQGKVVGGKEYEGFAACVERELKTWCFPGARQPSSLMFPMIFVKAEGETLAVPNGAK